MLTIQSDDRLMTAEDIAAQLGLSARTVRRLMDAGKLPSNPRFSSRQPYTVWRSALRARLEELKAQRAAANDDSEAEDADAA